jgi:inorganic pyrophosphatase
VHIVSLDEKPAFRPGGEELNVIIETPKGSRNKYGYDPVEGMFMLKTVLPAGAVFPFDFGFIPSTRAEDGDPIDVLVLMDEPAFAGCLVPARLLGAIEAEQTERNGATSRNDRLIAVAAKSRVHGNVRSLDDLSETLVHEIEHFFRSYNEIRGKRFDPKRRLGVEDALALVWEGIRDRKR